MEQITIYPERDLLIKLKDEAKKEKRSLNNFIICILLSYFENKTRGY